MQLLFCRYVQYLPNLTTDLLNNTTTRINTITACLNAAIPPTSFI